MFVSLCMSVSKVHSAMHRHTEKFMSLNLRFAQQDVTLCRYGYSLPRLLDKQSSNPDQPKVLQDLNFPTNLRGVSLLHALVNLRPNKVSELSQVFLIRYLLHINNSN